MEYFNLCRYITEEEKKKCNLNEALFRDILSKFPEVPGCSFEKPYFRCAYMYKFGATTLYFTTDCVKKFLSEYPQINLLFLELKSKSNLTVCSLSCGPALDYLGFLLGMTELMKSELQLSFSDVNVISTSCQWKATYKIMKELISFGFPDFPVIKLCDNLKIVQNSSLSFSDKHKNLVQDADILFMNKMTFPYSEVNLETKKIYLKNVIDTMKENSFMFCIDTKPNIDDLAQILHQIPGEYIFKPNNNKIKMPKDFPEFCMERYGCLPNFNIRGWFFVWKKLSLSSILKATNFLEPRSSMFINNKNIFSMICFNEYLKSSRPSIPDINDSGCLFQINNVNVETDVKILLDEICNFINVKNQSLPNPQYGEYISCPITNQKEIKVKIDSDSISTSKSSSNNSIEAIDSKSGRRRNRQRKNKQQIDCLVQNEDNLFELNTIQTDHGSYSSGYNSLVCSKASDSNVKSLETVKRDFEMKENSDKNLPKSNNFEASALTKKKNKWSQTEDFMIPDHKNSNINIENEVKDEKPEPNAIEILSDRIKNLVNSFENLLEHNIKQKSYHKTNSNEFQNASHSTTPISFDGNGSCAHSVIDTDTKCNRASGTNTNCDGLQIRAFSKNLDCACYSANRQNCRITRPCSCICSCLKMCACGSGMSKTCCAAAQTYNCLHEASTFHPPTQNRCKYNSQIQDDDSAKIVIPLQNISKDALVQITEILKAQSKSSV